MLIDQQVQDRPALDVYQRAEPDCGMHLFAASMLAAMITTLVLFWPIPYLGLNVDRATGVVIAVERGSIADRAGIVVGDRVVGIYDYAWSDADRQLFLFPLAWETVRAVPICIEHHGMLRTAILSVDTPSIAYQTEKIVAFVLGLICWITGYLLGLVRRHETPGTPIAAWFWMGLGGLVGCYTFAVYSSYPITIVLQWLLLTIIAPVSVFMHVWFPARPTVPGQAQAARRWLVTAMLVLQGAFVVLIVVWRPTLRALVDLLGIVLPALLTLCFVGSGGILWQAYQQTAIAQVRRQIRLIAFACFLVAFCWLTLRSLPTLAQQGVLLPHAWIDLFSGLVPLAYLLGAIVPDLYRADRVIRWLSSHMLTALILGSSITAVVQLLALQGPALAMWTALCFVVLYRPFYQLIQRLILDRTQPAHTYKPLLTTATRLAASLEASQLVSALCQGVQETFGHPPVGFYLGSLDGSNSLTLARQDRLHLPETIEPGALTANLCQLPLVTESRILHATFHTQSLDTVTESLLYHPGVVLWCPLHHSRGYLLGVLLLGMRGDLDPYRTEDLWELGRLLDTAVLAFTNSAAYREQAQAEQAIRQLYQRLQQVQDATAAAIARELHDEVINVNVRLNIESLERLLAHIREPALRNELAMALEGERTVGQILRQVCEDLHPAGIDNPLGLPAVLRRQVERVQRTWVGTCRLIIEQTPCPVDAALQWEALRITREALTNAIKHARATEVTVHLCYPVQAGGKVCLTVHDNGQSDTPVCVTPQGWGVRNMYESARAAGGTLLFKRAAGGGTDVIFTFDAQLEETNNVDRAFLSFVPEPASPLTNRAK